MTTKPATPRARLDADRTAKPLTRIVQVVDPRKLFIPCHPGCGPLFFEHYVAGVLVRVPLNVTS